MNNLNLAIVGSRSMVDYNFFSLMLMELIPSAKRANLIISGGAKGADSCGYKFARENNLKIKIFTPDWNLYGKKAGMMRNTDIISNSNMVIVFWDGKSAGTKDSIEKAKRTNKKLIVVYFKLLVSCYINEVPQFEAKLRKVMHYN